MRFNIQIKLLLKIQMKITKSKIKKIRIINKLNI